MKRRTLIAAAPALATLRSLMAAAGGQGTRLSLAAFTSHQHWAAVRKKLPGVKFQEARSFYEYARSLRADGAQVSLAGKSEEEVKAFRALVEKTGGCFEGDIRLPEPGADLTAFEREVKLIRAAGGIVARTVLTGTRRYEGFKSPATYREFQAKARRRMTAVLPVLEKHRLRLAVENHKDNLAADLADMIRKAGSEWLGVTLDTGNNLSLLEEPMGVIETLAPLAFTVHLKDMAVQPCKEGFLLSEVPFGEGCLDLPRVIEVIRKAQPQIVFNIEMATRDPLLIPCLTDDYWTSFDARNEAAIKAAMALVKANPPKAPVPGIKGKETAAVLAEEEVNNQRCIGWWREHERA